uniref:Uncharacterized protein n=1 Tax=Rhinolophus ferrumequinum TaxID=59479 RepID=A0A671G9P6_RHIFE
MPGSLVWRWAQLRKTSRKSVSPSVLCLTSTYCVLNTVPPLEDDNGNSNSGHVKIFLPKKMLECLPKCSSLPKSTAGTLMTDHDAALLLDFFLIMCDPSPLIP